MTTSQITWFQVMGNFAWMGPRVEEHSIRHELDPLWPKFSSIILEENHRQGDDKSYGDMLNRIRVEEHTPGNIKVFCDGLFPDMYC